MTKTDILAELGYILPRLTEEQQTNVYLLALLLDEKNTERRDSNADS